MSTLLQLLGTIPHSVLTMMKMKRRRGLRGGEEEEEKEEKRKERRLQREGKLGGRERVRRGEEDMNEGGEQRFIIMPTKQHRQYSDFSAL